MPHPGDVVAVVLLLVAGAVALEAGQALIEYRRKKIDERIAKRAAEIVMEQLNDRREAGEDKG